MDLKRKQGITRPNDMLPPMAIRNGHVDSAATKCIPLK